MSRADPSTVPDWSISETGAALRSGEFSAEDLARAHFDRIVRFDPTVRSFVHLTEDRALVAARQADTDFAAGIDRGPLQGIPFAIKDLIDLDGAIVTHGSRVNSERVAQRSAPAVQRLIDAGAVPLGMVATYDLAIVGPSQDGPYPPARNPWNPDHITGGSSSGSAAAVAAGLVRFALGTDTGGSIRSPSAYCGVVGLKPTFGAISLEGVQPLAPSLDHLGPIAASVMDAAIAFAVLTDTPVPALGRGLDGLRIGFAREWACGEDATPGLLERLDDAAAVLSLEGARVDLATLPDYSLLEAAGAVIIHAEALATHASAVMGEGGLTGRMAYQSLIAGAALTEADVTHARRAADRLRIKIDHMLEAYDAIVTATTLSPAPPFAAFAGGEAVWTPMRTLPFNVTGHPALSVPMGFVDGLPVGLQIVGRHGDEETILRIGAAFEAATDHSVMKPPLT